MAKRHDNGADFWATQDGRWGVGSPFSTFDCALILSELGLQRSDPVMKGVANQILSAWREDGRFRSSPKGAMHPCHTADAARALCHLGLRTTGCVERAHEQRKRRQGCRRKPKPQAGQLIVLQERRTKRTGLEAYARNSEKSGRGIAFEGQDTPG